MDIQQLSDLLNTFNFRAIVKDEAINYLRGNGHSFNSYRESTLDIQKFILNGLKIFNNKEDKVTNLLVTIDYLRTELASAVEELAKPILGRGKPL